MTAAGPGRSRSAGCGRGRERCVDLAGDVALQAAHDFAFGLAFSGATGDVVVGGLMTVHPDQRDPPEHMVGCPVAASVQPVPVGPPGRGWARPHPSAGLAPQTRSHTRSRSSPTKARRTSRVSSSRSTVRTPSAKSAGAQTRLPAPSGRHLTSERPPDVRRGRILAFVCTRRFSSMARGLASARLQGATGAPR